MAKVKVPLYGNPNRAAFLDTKATEGATIGLDLRLPDGSVPSLDQLAALIAARGGVTPGAPSRSSASPTLWRLIREIPPNVQQVENLSGSGLVTRRADGEWTTRAITVADSDRLTVADGAGEDGNPVIDLAELADSSDGALLAISRDAWGRVAGTREVVADDIPALPADKITSGIFPVERGGTGRDALTAAALLIGAGSDPVDLLAPGDAGHVVRSDGFTWTSAQLGFADLAGSIDDGQVPESAVKQYEGALSIDWSQLESVPDTASRWPEWGEVTDKPTFGTSAFIDENALSIDWSQISNAPPSGGQVDSVVGTPGLIDVDSSDAANPVISLDSDVLAALSAALSAVQPNDLAAVATSGDYGDLSNTPSIPADISGATFLTGSDETSTLANSRRLAAGANITLDDSTSGVLTISAAGGGGGGGQVDSVVGTADQIVVDDSDPENPVISLDSDVLTALSAALSAVQPDAIAIFQHRIEVSGSDSNKLVFERTGNDTDEKIWVWRQLLGGGELRLTARPDGSPASGGSDAITIARSGTTVTLIDLAAASINLNGDVSISGGLYWGGGSFIASSDDLADTASGSFTATLTGVSETVTGTIGWQRTGNVVTLWAPSTFFGSANAVGMSLSGLPVQIRPAVNQRVPCCDLMADSIGGRLGEAYVFSAGSIAFRYLADTAALVTFPSSGSKGVGSGWSITYTIG